MLATHASSPTYSVIIEMENCKTICWEEVQETLATLADQISEVTAGQPEVLLVHPGPESESADLIAAISRTVPRLLDVATVSAISVPDGRYYELKNGGISRASGDLILFLDSDSVPGPQWLATLLQSLDRADAVAASGYTYLRYEDLISRTLAMAWIFPLRNHDVKAAGKRSLNMNNCGFRADWIRANPFEIDNGFKVGCTKLMKTMETAHVPLARVPAYVKHAPLTGWRFLVWRALVTGRDADRKCEDLKSRSRIRRFRNAIQFWFKMEIRTIQRILGKYRQVEMGTHQVPLALLLGCLFYCIALLGQAGRVLGMVADAPETIPAYAEHH